MPYTVKFMNIKSMLIRNGYPKPYIDRCIMKYLNKKHETSVNSFTITPPMTTTINMRLPYCKRPAEQRLHWERKE